MFAGPVADNSDFVRLLTTHLLQVKGGLAEQLPSEGQCHTGRKEVNHTVGDVNDVNDVNVKQPRHVGPKFSPQSSGAAGQAESSMEVPLRCVCNDFASNLFLWRSTLWRWTSLVI